MDRYRDEGKLPEVANNHSDLEVLASPPKYNPNAVYIDSIPATRQKQKQFTICGIGAVTYSILLAIAVAITIGAAIGGSFGAQLSSCKKSLEETTTSTCPSSPTTTISGSPSSPSTTSSSTARLQNYTAPGISAIDTLRNDCTDGVVTTKWGNFTTDCGMNYVGGREAAEGGVMADIAGITTYSFVDCVSACGQVNVQSARYRSTVQCRSITWNLNLRNATERDGANCWLKNGTVKYSNDLLTSRNSMSAKLVL